MDSFVSQQFRQADTDGDGQVTFEDFCEYYQAMSLSRARLELRSTMGMEAERKQGIHQMLALGMSQALLFKWLHAQQYASSNS